MSDRSRCDAAMSHDPTDFDYTPRDLRPQVGTEADWLTATDPESMLRYLQAGRAYRTPVGRRKLRLFGVACCRRVLHLVESDSAITACVEFTERFADGDGAKTRLKKMAAANEAWVERKRHRLLRQLTILDLQIASAASRLCNADADRAAWAYTSLGLETSGDPTTDHPVLCQLLRCLFGNPFRPVAFDPSWRSETAVALATGIYDARAFDRLPILADALEEAGCDHPDVLAHCREPNAPHARGCWVVDGVLGKG